MSLFAATLICLMPVATDGDTVRCGGAAGATRVRIWGVMAPETGTAGAAEAKAALQRRVAGGLICEPRGASFSRTVALCYDGTGRDVALELLKVDKVAVEACGFTRSARHPLGYYETCAPIPRR